MATLEDKILGEKTHNYCSSSEESDGEHSDSEDLPQLNKISQEKIPSSKINKWEGSSTNTGPKGVLNDWQKFKQMEDEQRQEDDWRKLEMIKKMTLTVQSALDEEREKAALEDPELAELLNDEFLVNYQKQRMQEMMKLTSKRIFGDVIPLDNDQEFLDAIDKEQDSVKVVIHIYEESVDACRNMNKCLNKLALVHENVKFCTILGSNVGISKHFRDAGVPALLVYKAGSLIGICLKLSDELGEGFLPGDVQQYLVERGLLEDKTCIPALMKDESDDSSDDE